MHDEHIAPVEEKARRYDELCRIILKAPWNMGQRGTLAALRIMAWESEATPTTKPENKWMPLRDMNRDRMAEALGISAGAFSNHMRQFCDAGLMSTETFTYATDSRGELLPRNKRINLTEGDRWHKVTQAALPTELPVEFAPLPVTPAIQRDRARAAHTRRLANITVALQELPCPQCGTVGSLHTHIKCTACGGTFDVAPVAPDLPPQPPPGSPTDSTPPGQVPGDTGRQAEQPDAEQAKIVSKGKSGPSQTVEKNAASDTASLSLTQQAGVRPDTHDKSLKDPSDSDARTNSAQATANDGQAQHAPPAKAGNTDGPCLLASTPQQESRRPTPPLKGLTALDSDPSESDEPEIPPISYTVTRESKDSTLPQTWVQPPLWDKTPRPAPGQTTSPRPATTDEMPAAGQTKGPKQSPEIRQATHNDATDPSITSPAPNELQPTLWSPLQKPARHQTGQGQAASHASDSDNTKSVQDRSDDSTYHRQNVVNTEETMRGGRAGAGGALRATPTPPSLFQRHNRDFTTALTGIESCRWLARQIVGICFTQTFAPGQRMNQRGQLALGKEGVGREYLARAGGLLEAARWLQEGRNVGETHVGLSVVVIDIDEGADAFLRAHPELAGAPAVIHAGAPERCKLFVRVQDGDVLGHAKLKGQGAHIELFGNGRIERHTIVAGRHSSGAVITLLPGELPLISASQLVAWAQLFVPDAGAKRSRVMAFDAHSPSTQSGGESKPVQSGDLVHLAIVWKCAQTAFVSQVEAMLSRKKHRGQYVAVRDDDDTPSTRPSDHSEGRKIWRDYGTGESLDAFELYCRLKGLDKATEKWHVVDEYLQAHGKPARKRR